MHGVFRPSQGEEVRLRATGARTDERPRRKRGPDFSDAGGKGEPENPLDVRSADALLTSTRRHFFGDFLCVSKASHPAAQRTEAMYFEPGKALDPSFRWDDKPGQRHWIFDPRPSGMARWRSVLREPVARKRSPSPPPSRG